MPSPYWSIIMTIYIWSREKRNNYGMEIRNKKWNYLEK